MYCSLLYRGKCHDTTCILKRDNIIYFMQSLAYSYLCVCVWVCACTRIQGCVGGGGALRVSLSGYMYVAMLSKD